MKAKESKPRKSSALRDRFATEALHGVVITCATAEGVSHLERITKRTYGHGHAWMAKLAYELADAMLKERTK